MTKKINLQNATYVLSLQRETRRVTGGAGFEYAANIEKAGKQGLSEKKHLDNGLKEK